MGLKPAKAGLRLDRFPSGAFFRTRRTHRSELPPSNRSRRIAIRIATYNFYNCVTVETRSVAIFSGVPRACIVRIFNKPLELPIGNFPLHTVYLIQRIKIHVLT